MVVKIWRRVSPSNSTTLPIYFPVRAVDGPTVHDLLCIYTHVRQKLDVRVQGRHIPDAHHLYKTQPGIIGTLLPIGAGTLNSQRPFRLGIAYDHEPDEGCHRLQNHTAGTDSNLFPGVTTLGES